ncbi:MAG: SHOCT domain-containing protein [Actinomycetota bacterium]
MPSTLATINTVAAEGSVLASHRGGEEGKFFFLLLLLAAIGGGIYLFRRRRNGGAAAVAPTPPPAPPVSDARALLDERFAKGEIDQAEYEHRRAVLEGRSTTPPANESPAVPADDGGAGDEENR